MGPLTQQINFGGHKYSTRHSFTNRDASGKFPDFPADDEGGSAAIFKEKDPAEVEAEIQAKVGVVTGKIIFNRKIRRRKILIF